MNESLTPKGNKKLLYPFFSLPDIQNFADLSIVNFGLARTTFGLAQDNVASARKKAINCLYSLSLPIDAILGLDLLLGRRG